MAEVAGTFNGMYGPVLSADGMLYVVESDSHPRQIWEVNPSSLTGNKTSVATGFEGPRGLTISADGSTLYVAEKKGISKVTGRRNERGRGRTFRFGVDGGRQQEQVGVDGGRQQDQVGVDRRRQGRVRDCHPYFRCRWTSGMDSPRPRSLAVFSNGPSRTRQEPSTP